MVGGVESGLFKLDSMGVFNGSFEPIGGLLWRLLVELSVTIGFNEGKVGGGILYNLVLSEGGGGFVMSITGVPLFLLHDWECLLQECEELGE